MGRPVLASGFAAVLRALLVLAATPAVSVARQAIDDPHRPSAARRVPAAWDFELDTAIYDLPPDWYRGNPVGDEPRRPGFPFYNRAILSRDAAASGEVSMKLPTLGGSTSVRFRSGKLVTVPGADYVVAARVRTEGLARARAVVVAQLVEEVPHAARLDEEHRYRPVGAEARSPAILSEGVWKDVRIRLGGQPTAISLRIELLLLQPEGPGFDDVRGAAYFDDVQIIQVPRLSLDVGGSTQVHLGPTPPEIRLGVRDSTGEALRAEMRVWSLDGDVVASHALEDAAALRGATWRPELPAYGWYRATLDAVGPQGHTGRSVRDFLWAPAFPADGNRDERFGVVARPADAARLAELAEIVRRLGVGALHLDAWHVRDGAESDEILEAALERLLESGTEVTFVLGALPPALAQASGVEREEPFAILARSPETWLRSIEPLLTTFGERIRRWQLGRVGDVTPRMAGDADLVAAGVERALGRLVPSPVVIVPWQTSFGPPATSHAHAVLVPTDVAETAVPGIATLHEGAPGSTLVLDHLDAEVFGHGAVVTDLARRAATAGSAGAGRMVVRAPWSWRDGSQIEPTPVAGAWRTLAATLADCSPAGVLLSGDATLLIGIRADGTGVLVAWADVPDDDELPFRAYLGGGDVRVVDLFGNRLRVPLRDGRHVLRLGARPVLVEGIDPELTRFRASLRIEPEMVPSVRRRHQLELVVANPWSTGIAGFVNLARPEAWSMQPGVVHFAIPPGEERRFPFTASFTGGELSGPREVLLEAELVADLPYPRILVPLHVDVGLEHVEMHAVHRLAMSADGRLTDILVEATVTNRGERPLTATVIVQASGVPRQERLVSALEPGGSVVRRVQLERAALELRGKRIRVTLRDQAGTGTLNRELTVE